MEVKFLKVKVIIAIKMLTDCMNKGYDAMIHIRQEFYQNPGAAQQNNARWNSEFRAWKEDTVKVLNEIYDEPSRVHNFREKKVEHLSFNGDTMVTAFENEFDDRIQILKGYYTFIMHRTSITINNSGTMNINHQEGDDLTNEQS